MIKPLILLMFLVLAISLIFPSEADAWLQTYEVAWSDYGFFAGIWHGLIAPFAVFAHIFDSDIILYSSTNNGFFYNLGFLIGISSVIGGGARSTR